MGTATNQSASAQTQNAAQPQDSGEMALAILQDALGDGGAREAQAAQDPQSVEGAAATDDDNKPEGGAPGTSDENPVKKALAAKEAPQKGLQNQHAALTRRTRALEAEKQRLEQRQAELESKQSELEKIDGISDMVEFVAKRRGIPVAEVWEDVVDQIKNGGRRSPTNKAVRAVEELRRDILADRQSKAQPTKQSDEQPDPEAIEQAVADWKSQAVETVTKLADRFPVMSRLPARALAAAAYDFADWVFETTGEVPTHEQVLEHLESQATAGNGADDAPPPKTQPAPAAVKGGAKAPVVPPKQKAKTISNRDAAEAPDARNMSQEDRDAAAMRILEQALA